MLVKEWRLYRVFQLGDHFRILLASAMMVEALSISAVC